MRDVFRRADLLFFVIFFLPFRKKFCWMKCIRKEILPGHFITSFYKGCVMSMQFTAIFQKVPEGYIAFVEELPGANAQGKTLRETRSSLREAVQLVLEANRS